MADDRPGAPGFDLAFVGGRGVLSVEGRPLAPWGRVDRLELEIPDLRFPFDLSGGPARFCNRRCRLRHLALSMGEEDLAKILEGVRFEEVGISGVRATLSGGSITLAGHAMFAGKEAPFTSRAALRLLASRALGLTFFDTRVYGFVPLAAPIIAGVVQGALLATTGFDPLEEALLRLLPAAGWRLPGRDHVVLVEAAIEGGRIRIRYEATGGTQAGAGVAVQPVADSTLIDDLAVGNHALAGAEAALAGGEVTRACQAYRGALNRLPGNRFVLRRLMQILMTAGDTLRQADEVAGAALALWPGWGPALLTKAVVAAQQDRPLMAATLFETLAAQAAREGSSQDAEFARACFRDVSATEGRPGEPKAAVPVAESARVADISGEEQEHLARADEFRREKQHAELAGVLEQLLAIREHAEAAGTSGLVADPRRDVEFIGIELAGLWARRSQQGRAESLLRRLIVRDPLSARPLEVLSELLWARGMRGEADKFMADRMDIEQDPGVLARVLLARTERWFSVPGGQRQALDLLRGLALEEMPVEAVEGLSDAYQRFGLHKEASDLWARLGRALVEPRRRAEALFRQGEILRSALGDLDAANDAYLRSSDLDPSFAPTLRRLVHYYWKEGDFVNLADVGAELAASQSAVDAMKDDIGLLVALGLDLGRGNRPAARVILARLPLAFETVAGRVLELAGRVGRQSPGLVIKAAELLSETQGPDFVSRLKEVLRRRRAEEHGEARGLPAAGPP